MGIQLYDHQIEAVTKMKNGCILCGGVGSGKSRTAIYYYFTKVIDGSLPVNNKGRYLKPRKPKNLVIITTAKKRDTKEWEDELKPFRLSTNIDESVCGIKVSIDSWNNIKKYIGRENEFFIFDEQRVVGYGAWTKAFLKITKRNEWILLSATPGDQWVDYAPVFIANGFYKNITEFRSRHCVYERYSRFPSIKKYIDTGILMKHRNDILVDMKFDRPTISHNVPVICKYDKVDYRMIMVNRWNIYDNEPIMDISQLCYLLRKVVNSDSDRIEKVKELMKENPRTIIFYNFDYELDILRKICDDSGIQYSEWNGHKHQPILKTEKWAYLVQYAACEGWNCIDTNVIIFYSQNYSYRTTVQAAGRIDRLNTLYTDLYYYYVRSAAPIDIAINKALKRKRNFNEARYFSN